MGYFLDAVSVTLVFYLLMRFCLGQSVSKALYRSVLLGALELVWVLLFGYNVFPNKLNPHLQF